MPNNIDYQIVVDAIQAERALADRALLLPRRINSLLAASAILVKGEMSKNAPRGVAGVNGQGLANTIGYTVDQALHKAEIKPTVPYADAVETGSRPHMPPMDPNGSLAQWAEMKGISLWAIAKSIAKRGTKAHPYIQPTYQKTQKSVNETISLGIKAFLDGAYGGI